jgi:hypothetical protein
MKTSGTTAREPKASRVAPSLQPKQSPHGPIPLLGVAFVWCVLAIIVYAPFNRQPLDLVDFSEFLPLLRANETIIGRWSALNEYFAMRGRASVSTYGLIALNYELWGENSVGWQVVRAMQLAVAATLLYKVLLRWKATQLGAGLGALLIVCSRSAAPNWTRIVAAESVGLILILLMFLLATGIQDRRRPGFVTAAICLTVAATLSFKEVWAPVIVATWVVALFTNKDGLWRWRKPNSALWILMLATSITAIACLTPVAIIAVNAPEDAYSKLYGTAPLDAGLLLIRYVTTLSPFQSIAADMNLGVAMTLASFVVLVAVGWRLYRAGEARRTHANLLLGFACTLPLLGVTGYLPWPGLFDFYALPYITGIAILIAFAVSGFNANGRRATSIALGLCVVPFSFMSTSAHRSANQSRASIAVAHEVTRDLADGNPRDTIILAVNSVADRAWIGLGALLTRQAHVNGNMFPTLVEFECSEARKQFQAGFSNRMVAFQSECGSLGPPQSRVIQRYSWFSWSRGGIVSDSVTVDFFRTE